MKSRLIRKDNLIALISDPEVVATATDCDDYSDKRGKSRSISKKSLIAAINRLEPFLYEVQTYDEKPPQPVTFELEEPHGTVEISLNVINSTEIK